MGKWVKQVNNLGGLRELWNTLTHDPITDN